MIKRIAHKEFLEMLRDKRLLIAALIVGALLLVSLALGYQHSREVRRQHESAEALTYQQWLNQGDKGPHSAAHYGIYAFKPQSTLAFIDRGIEPYTGVAVWLEAHKQNDFRYRPAQDQTLLARFGELTAATVLQLLLPLLIILLSFSTFVSERENGTLRQVLSLGIHPGKLAVGKIVGVVSVLSMLLIPSIIIGVIALSLSGTAEASSLMQIILMIMGYLLYLGIFACISLSVSAHASSSRAALLTLLAVWIFSCLIVPRVSTDIARYVHPTPSAFEFNASIDAAMKDGVDGHNSADKRLADLKNSTMQKYGVKRLEDLPVNFDGIALQAGEDFGYQVYDAHYGRLWNQFLEQERLRRYIAIGTPTLAIASFSRGLAGTDFYQHREFASTAENYRRSLIKILNDDVTQNARYGDTTYVADKDLWAKVPAFEYSEIQLSRVVKEQVGNVGILAGWFVLSVIFMFRSGARMRVL
jgi:ABC-2 type transport system permease protein